VHFRFKRAWGIPSRFSFSFLLYLSPSRETGVNRILSLSPFIVEATFELFLQETNGENGYAPNITRVLYTFPDVFRLYVCAIVRISITDYYIYGASVLRECS